MKQEFEVRVLEVDELLLKKKIEALDAIKVGEYEQRRYVYDFHPVKEGKWIRLRTNSFKTTLAIKDIRKNKDIGDVKELEFEVKDFDKANMFLEQLGYPYRSYQENRRQLYKLGDIDFAFDKWPFIPMYLEVEGKNKKIVLEILEKLEIKDYTLLNVKDIYREVYHIDIDRYRELKEEA